MSAVKKMNIVDIENGLEELTALNLSPVEYGKALVTLFGSTTTLKRLGTNKANTSEFDNGLLWRDKLHYVPCPPGKINQTLEGAKAADKTLKGKVRLVIVNDGSHILVFDRKYNELTDCTVDTIKDEPQLFLPLVGLEGFRREVENDVDIKATGKLAKLYDALIERNPEWLIGDKRHSLNHLMTQIIFCLFAEDTGIFPKDIFTKALKNRAGADGEHTANVIVDIFSVLDIHDTKRGDIAPWLNESKFPYVNGGLFSGPALVPEFTAKAHRYLIEAANLDWKHINPDILGSSIQAIVDPTMRGNLGMHYTSVPNILKTLEPLFLNELRDELFKSRHAKKLINAFLERLSKIVVFDPACGSGNFLVIAYRELRKLELQALDALRDLDGGASLAFSFGSVILLSNFYGIEYADFAAETAKLALWIAEYQQNARFVAAFGADIPALPLKDSGNIHCSNALIIEWAQVLGADKSKEIYICSNPPFLGKNKQEHHHKLDMDHVFKGLISGYRSLDYVSAWYIKCLPILKNYNAKAALVSTNSLVQGLSVTNLWPYLLEQKVVIKFCVLPFKWRNNAADLAGVTCVVIGFNCNEHGERLIFDDSKAMLAKNINPYLIDGPNIIPIPRKTPLSDVPTMRFGNMPYDTGALILSNDEVTEAINDEPRAKAYLKPLYGSQEFISGSPRWCIWIKKSELDEANKIDLIKKRIDLCRENRLKSKDRAGVKLAETPYKFRESHESMRQTIIIPSVSSELRAYLPVGVLSSNNVVSNLAFALYDGDILYVSIICSNMHKLWIKTICGALETRIRYSNTLGWHTFPIPNLSENQRKELEQSARRILLCREAHYPKSISDLYKPGEIPQDLFDAHIENDRLVESLYSDQLFNNDVERLNHLFERYVEMTKGL